MSLFVVKLLTRPNSFLSIKCLPCLLFVVRGPSPQHPLCWMRWGRHLRHAVALSGLHRMWPLPSVLQWRQTRPTSPISSYWCTWWRWVGIGKMYSSLHNSIGRRMCRGSEHLFALAILEKTPACFVVSILFDHLFSPSILERASLPFCFNLIRLFF